MNVIMYSFLIPQKHSNSPATVHCYSILTDNGAKPTTAHPPHTGNIKPSTIDFITLIRWNVIHTTHTICFKVTALQNTALKIRSSLQYGLYNEDFHLFLARSDGRQRSEPF